MKDGNEDFYFENGLLVLTEAYHRKRGWCCGNGCRHCPYDHVAVPRPAANDIAEDRDSRTDD